MLLPSPVKVALLPSLVEEVVPRSLGKVAVLPFLAEVQFLAEVALLPLLAEVQSRAEVAPLPPLVEVQSLAEAVLLPSLAEVAVLQCLAEEVRNLLHYFLQALFLLSLILKAELHPVEVRLLLQLGALKLLPLAVLLRQPDLLLAAMLVSPPQAAASGHPAAPLPLPAEPLNTSIP